jgi:hypothetical protein
MVVLHARGKERLLATSSWAISSQLLSGGSVVGRVALIIATASSIALANKRYEPNDGCDCSPKIVSSYNGMDQGRNVLVIIVNFRLVVHFLISDMLVIIGEAQQASHKRRLFSLLR